MSRPLRGAVDYLRHASHKFSRIRARLMDGRRAYRHMKEIHSDGAIVRKVVGVWKREGLAGLRNRLVTQTAGSALARLDNDLLQVASLAYQDRKSTSLNSSQ